jgi:serine/threonine protein phosphatase PrpC
LSRTLALEAAARTDIGRVRETNEDALVLRPDLGLFERITNAADA